MMDNVVAQFLADGQKRRAWLDNTLSRMLPPELDTPMNVLDMFNPVSDVGRAMAAGRTVFNPDADRNDRIRAAGDMTVDMASVLAPAVGLKMAGDIGLANVAENAKSYLAEYGF